MKNQKLASQMKLNYQSGEEMESREVKGSVKVWELDSDNNDVYNDSDTDVGMPVNRRTN